MALNVNGTKLKKCNVNSAKCKKINVNGTTIWKAESDIYTLTAEVTKSGATEQSDYIVNSEGYEYLVIDSAVATGGNHGNNKAWLYIGDEWVRKTQKGTSTDFITDVATWSGKFGPLNSSHSVYVAVYTYRNAGIDDHTDSATVTVNFHFE